MKVGGGQTAKVGDRVAVHYEARWKGVTFMTSRCAVSHLYLSFFHFFIFFIFHSTSQLVYILCRQGMGVTGGSPIGFDVVCGMSAQDMQYLT